MSGAGAMVSLSQANVFLLAIFVGTLLAFGALGLAVLSGRAGTRRLHQRVGRLRERWGANSGAEPTAARLRRNLSDSAIPALDRLIKRLLPAPALLRRRLARTGRRITLGEYLLASLFLGVVVGAIPFIFLSSSPVLSVFVGIVVGLGLPHLVVAGMGAKRMTQFLAVFPDAIELIVRGLKSGLPVTESVTIVGDEVADPVGAEFRHMTHSMKLGQPMEEALHDAAERIPVTDFQFFVISLSVQKETGGNLAETLENLATILRRRHQMKLKIRAMSSEARASAYIIGSLPFLLGTLIYVLNPEYASVLWTDPRGQVLVWIGLAWLAVGAGVMAKMVRFEI